MKSCVFCEILAGRAPASVVWEDEHCIALLDIRPVQRGHALVLPRHHAVHLDEIDETLRGHLFRVASRLLTAQQRAGLPSDGGNIFINDGSAAGQTVPHVHLHVVPRGRGDKPRVIARLAMNLLRLAWLPASRHGLDRTAEAVRNEMRRLAAGGAGEAQRPGAPRAG